MEKYDLKERWAINLRDSELLIETFKDCLERDRELEDELICKLNPELVNQPNESECEQLTVRLNRTKLSIIRLAERLDISRKRYEIHKHDITNAIVETGEEIAGAKNVITRTTQLKAEHRLALEQTLAFGKRVGFEPDKQDDDIIDIDDKTNVERNCSECIYDKGSTVVNPCKTCLEGDTNLFEQVYTHAGSIDDGMEEGEGLSDGGVDTHDDKINRESVDKEGEKK